MDLTKNKWWSQRTEFCRQLLDFFWKFCFSLRTPYKGLICCTDNPDAYICTFCKRWSFIWQCFSPVSILNYRNRTILSYLVRRSILFLTRYDRQKIVFLNILTLRQIDVIEKVRLNTQKTHYDERWFRYYFFCCPSGQIIQFINYSKFLQKQPQEVLCKKRYSYTFRKNSQENFCARVFFLIKLQI